MTTPEDNVKEQQNAGQDNVEAADANTVSVSGVSCAGCTGEIGGLREAESATRSGEEA